LQSAQTLLQLGYHKASSLDKDANMCYGKCDSVGCANEAVFCDRDNRVFCEVCYHADENDLDVMFSDGEDDVVFDDDDYEYDDSMDGDHASGLASAGWGTDEDYYHDSDGFYDWE
jgi:hypothetical protein